MHSATRIFRLGNTDANWAPINTPGTPPISRSVSVFQGTPLSPACRPPPTAESTRPNARSVPTTSDGARLLNRISTRVPSAPAPADENPTSKPIGATIHESHFLAMGLPDTGPEKLRHNVA